MLNDWFRVLASTQISQMKVGGGGSGFELEFEFEFELEDCPVLITEGKVKGFLRGGAGGVLLGFVPRICRSSSSSSSRLMTEVWG